MKKGMIINLALKHWKQKKRTSNSECCLKSNYCVQKHFNLLRFITADIINRLGHDCFFFSESKLTSLEEFRIEKDAFTLRFQALEKLLKEKEEEIPLQLDRKERQTVLQIEAYFSFESPILMVGTGLSILI